jgi:hypothetical protein
VCVVGDVICLANKTKFTTTMSYNKARQISCTYYKPTCSNVWTHLLKHVKDKYGTIQEPGQSGRSSGGAGVVVVVVLVVAGGLGLGRGLDGVTPEAAPRVLSQHTEPLWQLDVWAIRTDGRSQNAAIMLIRQKPGQRGNGS